MEREESDGQMEDIYRVARPKNVPRRGNILVSNGVSLGVFWADIWSLSYVPSKSLVLALPNVTCQGWTETGSVLLQLRSVL